MTLWIETLLRLVALVDQRVAEAEAEAGEFDHANYQGWKRRHDSATLRLITFFEAEERAVFKLRGAHEHSVKMAGIRSTSTSGWIGSLQNWKRSAETRIAAEAGSVVKADPINLQGSGPAPIEPREGGRG